MQSSLAGRLAVGTLRARARRPLVFARLLWPVAIVAADLQVLDDRHALVGRQVRTDDPLLRRAVLAVLLVAVVELMAPVAVAGLRRVQTGPSIRLDHKADSHGIELAAAYHERRRPLAGGR